MVEIKPSVLSDVKTVNEWKSKVLDRDGHQCVNCTSKINLAPCFLIPPEAGGKLITTNGATFCRGCRLAAEEARVLPTKIDNKTPINFLISKELHHAVETFVHNGSNFGSISALVRKMITSFINEPELFEDLKLWQSEGSDVKCNGWVPGHQYSVFRTMCQERDISYTDALKALLLVAIDGYSPKNESH